LNYLSVCSGIEAATVGWHHMGWNPIAFSEIEKFPSQVLAHHYPNVPNLGDMTKYKEWELSEPIDILVGGTPCQSFSVAGLRKGLDDPRGNLALTYVGILDKFRPKWCIWENVPGVLSSGGGRDFGSFLGALGEVGYGWAYRVLDAQYFGVPQRRRRVFVVGCLGDWRSAAEVLFDPHSLSGNTKKGRKARERVAYPVADCAPTLCARDYKGVGNYKVAGGGQTHNDRKSIAYPANKL
jgi:DNA (cytosine-5)-methyltransferase 1